MMAGTHVRLSPKKGKAERGGNEQPRGLEGEDENQDLESGDLYLLW
jgi:hypothetical protein